MFLNTILDSILDLVFPAKCIACGKTGTLLCLVCLSEAPPAERESATWIFPLYDYRHPIIKKSLWLLKYGGKKQLANVFAESIYGKMMEELSELSVLENFNNAILIPIPLSRKRYRERGFNQAELICREIMRLSEMRNQSLPASLCQGRSLPHPFAPLLPRRGVGERCPPDKGDARGLFTFANDILIKPKDTEHQARIKDRRVRLKNMTGTFAVKNLEKSASLIKNRNIILIDDITTTGATLNEARKTLRQAGARKVIAFTVAH